MEQIDGGGGAAGVKGGEGSKVGEEGDAHDLAATKQP